MEEKNTIEKTKNVQKTVKKATDNIKTYSEESKPTAPYNFVPLNDVVLRPPLYKYIKSCNEVKSVQEGYRNFLLDGKKYSGYCEVDIENITPLYIGGADKKFFSDGKNICIPGSSLRGCLKNIFKIITNGAMRIDKKNPDITDKILYFRNMAAETKDPSRDLYYDKLNIKKINGGFLVKENKKYFICKAKLEKGDNKIDPNPPEAPCIKWNDNEVYIFSGKMIGKNNFYSIKNPEWKNKYIIPDDILNGYRNDKNRKGLDLLKVENHKKGTDREQFLKGAENFDYIVPCFFVENNGIVEHFGGNFYYRLPYNKSIGEHIPESLKSEKIDFADAVFGNKEYWSSRIFVEDCYLDSNTTVLDKQDYTKILMEPKPTSFQFYLTTDDKGKAQHWESEANIRGYKFYWHKKMNWIGKKNKNENINKWIAPLKPKHHFKGKIRFENLDEVELGAFMYLFDIARKKDICYKLGMGKPIGMGSVKLIGKFYLQGEDYYKKLFTIDKQNFAECTRQIDQKFFVDKFLRYVKENLSKESFSLYKSRLNDLESILSISYMQKQNSEKWNNFTRYMGFGSGKSGDYKNDAALIKKRVPLPTIKEVVKK